MIDQIVFTESEETVYDLADIGLPNTKLIYEVLFGFPPKWVLLNSYFYYPLLTLLPAESALKLTDEDGYSLELTNEQIHVINQLIGSNLPNES